MTRALVIALAACSASAPASKPPPPTPMAAAVEQPKHVEVDETARRAELVAAHRKLEEEQQDALGASCPADKKETEKHERCLPSCYATEPPDPRAGKKLAGGLEIAHLVCAAGDGFAIVDELDGKLAARPLRGRVPAAHKKGSWQADVERALSDGARPKLARGDAFIVAGNWHDVEHPQTKERLRCVAVSHYTRLRKPLDGCGSDGALACEATGNAAARAINVVHYRLAEARRLQAAGKTTECQQAALEAVAVARGLPRWRQYVKLNVAKWVDHAGYRTRFDGVLDEDALFTTTARLGTDAEGVYVVCGGPAGAPTTAAQEQSFHTCW